MINRSFGAFCNPACVLAILLLLSALSKPACHAAQAQRTTPPPLQHFRDPPATSRPKFRYWLPDASVPASDVQADVRSLAEVSAGGLEFLGFYNQGFPPISTDWSKYGFGTPAFKEILRAALQTTAEHSLVFDFAVGPNTAHGVPAIPGSEGLAMELVYGARTIAPSQRAGSLPPPKLDFNHGFLNGWVHEPENWGPSQLVAVVGAEVVGRSRKAGGSSGEVVRLNESNVVDLTNLTRNGVVDWQAPSSGRDGREWVVLAFYQRYSNERSCVSIPDAPTWIGNGSWMVDHFSPSGAKKTTDFWDQHLLDDGEIDKLMRQVGKYSWEDSMEMMSPLWWTPNFLARFESARGYSAIKYLPVFFQAKNLWNSYGDPYDTSYQFDGQPTDGGKYAEDYRLTLTEGYEDFLREYQSWAEARGMDHSAQPAYNMPLDMSSSIPLIGGPELESLGFSESIDNYRQFTGPAHLFNRNDISTEIGAQRGGAYAQTVPKLLNLFRDSFAAGVNTLVIHGFPYTGSYPGTTWPGYTPFQYEFCEMWGPRQPAWPHMNDTLLYAARNSEVLKAGVPRLDIAFYVWKQPWSARPVYQGDKLTAAGYTFEYLGPENLASANSSVRSGVLAPDGPAYKAVVLYKQARITAAASAALVKFAEGGLPIFIVGAVPNTTIGATGQEEVSENMSILSSGGFRNVRVLSESAFGPEAILSSGVVPRVSTRGGGGAADASRLYSMWRTDNLSGTEFVYLLNRGPEATFNLQFNTDESSIPYVLDAWTGEQTHLAAYQRSGRQLSANITLSEQQSTILAFSTPPAEQNGLPLHVISHSSNLAHIRENEDGRIEGLVNSTASANAFLSDNRRVEIPALGDFTTSPITLGPWNLTVESYSAPEVLTTTSVTGTKTIVTIPTPLRDLVPWTRVRGLERASGLGTYRASLILPPTRDNGTELSYTIHFAGRVLNTIRTRVNGMPVPAIDLAAPAQGRDITALLKMDHENLIEVEVSSTLFNAVKARMNSLRSVGKGTQVPKYYTDVDWAEFGLVGNVVIQTWRRVLLT